MRKTRIISLRLSEEEFERLKSMYGAHGARGISEFARTAMYTMLSWQSISTALELKLREIDGKVTVLDSELARISRILAQEIGTPRDGSNENH